MNGHGGREWERALRKYDELAIRYDQMKKVFDELKLVNKADETWSISRFTDKN